MVVLYQAKALSYLHPLVGCKVYQTLTQDYTQHSLLAAQGLGGAGEEWRRRADLGVGEIQ